MTPRQIKEALYEAAYNNDARLALMAAKAFYEQKLWTSSSHWRPEQPNGTEVLLIAKKPGTCAICGEDFEANTSIRWRSRVDCHAHCWDNLYA
jgi:hypothetical protein